ncbi:MAG: porin, partial [Myxococcota bacterium]
MRICFIVHVSCAFWMGCWAWLGGLYWHGCIAEVNAAPVVRSGLDPRFVPQSISFRPGKGLTVRTKNDYFVLNIRARMQFLYSFDVESQELLQSIRIRRARLLFGGSWFGKHNKFKLELAISPNDIDLSDGVVRRSPLLDGYVDFDYLRDLSLRIGQYKVPYSWERVASSGNQLFVDRSIVNREFTLDRDIGLELYSKDLGGWGLFRYHLGVYIGEGHSSFEKGDLGLMYIARFEYTPLGRFKGDYTQGDLMRRRVLGLRLGVGYSFLDEAKRNRGLVGSEPKDGGTTDFHNINADILLKLRGWSLYGVFMWRQGTRNPGEVKNDVDQPRAVELARSGIGYMVHMSY